MSFSTAAGNFLYHQAFPVYKPVYALFKRWQDRHEISLLRKHIRPGDQVLDVGANIGFYARLLASLTGKKGRVYCFEPDPANFSHLQKSCGDMENLVLVRSAIGASSGEISFFKSGELNVDHRTYRPETFAEEIRVPVLSIDDYVRRNSIHHVDFVKMDIQGFEPEAIRGMHETLAANKNLRMITEFWPYGLKTSGGSALSYYDQLKSLELHVYLLGASLQEMDEAMVKRLDDGSRAFYNVFISRSRV